MNNFKLEYAISKSKIKNKKMIFYTHNQKIKLEKYQVKKINQDKMNNKKVNKRMINLLKAYLQRNRFHKGLLME